MNADDPPLTARSGHADMTEPGDRGKLPGSIGVPVTDLHHPVSSGKPISQSRPFAQQIADKLAAQETHIPRDCSAVLIAIALHSHIDGTGAHPGLERIRAITRLARTTICAAIDELKAHRVLIVQPRFAPDGGRTSDGYVCFLDAWDAWQESPAKASRRAKCRLPAGGKAGAPRVCDTRPHAGDTPAAIGATHAPGVCDACPPVCATHAPRAGDTPEKQSKSNYEKQVKSQSARARAHTRAHEGGIPCSDCDGEPNAPWQERCSRCALTGWIPGPRHGSEGVGLEQGKPCGHPSLRWDDRKNRAECVACGAAVHQRDWDDFVAQGPRDAARTIPTPNEPILRPVEDYYDDDPPPDSESPPVRANFGAFFLSVARERADECQAIATGGKTLIPPQIQTISTIRSATNAGTPGSAQTATGKAAKPAQTPASAWPATNERTDECATKERPRSANTAPDPSSYTVPPARGAREMGSPGASPSPMTKERTETHEPQPKEHDSGGDRRRNRCAVRGAGASAEVGSEPVVVGEQGADGSAARGGGRADPKLVRGAATPRADLAGRRDCRSSAIDGARTLRCCLFRAHSGLHAADGYEWHDLETFARRIPEAPRRPTKGPTAHPPDVVGLVWAAYAEARAKARLSPAVLDDARALLIMRWSGEFSVEDLCDAAAGIFLDEWCVKKMKTSINYALKSAELIEQFRDLKRKKKSSGGYDPGKPSPRDDDGAAARDAENARMDREQDAWFARNRKGKAEDEEGAF